MFVCLLRLLVLIQALLVDSRDRVPAMAGFSTIRVWTSLLSSHHCFPVRVHHPAGVRQTGKTQMGQGRLTPRTPTNFPLRAALIVSAGLKGLWSLLLLSPFLWYPLTQSLASQGGGGEVHPWPDLQQQGHWGWVLILRGWLASQVGMEKKSVLRSPSLSNVGPVEWLPQRMVERSVALPSTR